MTGGGGWGRRRAAYRAVNPPTIPVPTTAATSDQSLAASRPLRRRGHPQAPITRTTTTSCSSSAFSSGSGGGGGPYLRSGFDRGGCPPARPQGRGGLLALALGRRGRDSPEREGVGSVRPRHRCVLALQQTREGGRLGLSLGLPLGLALASCRPPPHTARRPWRRAHLAQCRWCQRGLRSRECAKTRSWRKEEEEYSGGGIMEYKAGSIRVL